MRSRFPREARGRRYRWQRVSLEAVSAGGRREDSLILLQQATHYTLAPLRQKKQMHWRRCFDFWLLLINHLCPAMSILSRSKDRKRSADSIYDMLHLVRPLLSSLLVASVINGQLWRGNCLFDFPFGCHTQTGMQWVTALSQTHSGICCDKIKQLLGFIWPLENLECSFSSHGKVMKIGDLINSSWTI